MNIVQLLETDRLTDDGAGISSRANGILVDLSCIVLALAALVLIGTDSNSPLRAPVVLIFILFVPGWTILRRCGATASVLTYVSGMALSVVLMILMGESLVLFGNWKWFPVGLALTAACSTIGATSMIHRYRMAARSGFHSGRPASNWAERLSVPTVVTVVAGNSLVALGIRHTKDQNFGILGLVDVLSPAYWAGLAVLVGGLVFACSRRSRWAWLSVAALVIALHGLPGMLEPNPRFNVAWLHTGFVQQIANKGTLLRGLDARFSWAGFFAAGGLLQRWSGTESLLWMVRYAPLFYNGVAVVLVALLARRLHATEMQAVFAATLFSCLNWIGQDYFAPQATAFVLYLFLITVVLYAFPGDPSQGRRWLVRLTRPGGDDRRALHGRDGVLVLLGCYVLVVAVVISHQLTPGFMLSAMLLLVAANSTRLRVLPVFIAVVFLAWLSFGGSAYWFGHFNNLTGSVGQVGDLVKQNVGSRTGSQVLNRQIVIASRIGLALLAWGLASLSIVIQWVRRSTPITLVCLLAAPFPMLVLQPYGGEMALRVCYFTLPAACILIAQLLVPAGRVNLTRWIACGVAILVLLPIFITARFGNESFEAFSNDDVLLARTTYELVPDGSTVFVATAQTTDNFERVGVVRFRSLPRGTPAQVTDVLAKKYLRKSTPVFVELSESQQAHGVTLDRPADWMQVLIKDLMLTGRYVVRVRVGDGVLLEMKRL